jgi:O-antigen ligase
MRTLAFLVSLAFVFFIPWEGVELPTVGSMAKYVGFVAAASWLLAVVWSGRVRAPGVFQAVVFGFVFWNGLSVLWSDAPAVSADRAMTWAQLLVFVLLLWDLYTTRSAVLAGLQGYVLGAYVAVSSAVMNFLGGSSFYSHYDRFSAGDTNPDGFGFLLALGMPVAWYLTSSKAEGRLARALRVANFAYIPTAFLGIALSGTRTALIATIPAMAFGLSSLMRLSRAARLGAVLLLAAALFLVMGQVQSLRSFQRFGTTVSEFTEGDLNNRTNNWLQGLESFVRHPLLGVGANMYRSVNNLGKVAHNSYLSVLVETGLVGLTLFGAILAIAVGQALRQAGWERSFWLSLLAVWAIGASTLTWEHRKSTWLFLSLIVASAAAARAREEAKAVVHGAR